MHAQAQSGRDLLVAVALEEAGEDLAEPGRQIPRGRFNEPGQDPANQRGERGVRLAYDRPIASEKVTASL